MDIGATHNLTSDTNMLQQALHYNSDSSIMLGNGFTILITHSSSVYLSSLTKILKLQNLLCMLQLEKNFFVKQLCKDNKVIIEFFIDYFYVKDLATKTTILMGARNIVCIKFLWPMTLLRVMVPIL